MPLAARLTSLATWAVTMTVAKNAILKGILLSRVSATAIQVNLKAILSNRWVANYNSKCLAIYPKCSGSAQQDTHSNNSTGLFKDKMVRTAKLECAIIADAH